MSAEPDPDADLLTPDAATLVDLDDVGGDGLSLVVCIDGNGAGVPLIVNRDVLQEQREGNWSRAYAHTGPPPVHEFVGPLPWSVSLSVWGPRCGHPRASDGQPCRQRVGHPLSRCRHHRAVGR